MASFLSLQLSQSFYLKSFGSINRIRTTFKVPHPSNFNSKEQQGEYGFAKNNIFLGFLCSHYDASSRRFSSRALSSTASSASASAYAADHTDSENGHHVAATRSHDMEFNRVNCLIWVLHESARSFSLMIQSLELAQSGPELSMAWVGVDVHAWHKQIAYQVAVYALLKSVVDVDFLLFREHGNNTSPVCEILSPKINFIRDHIERQLNTRHPELVQWFRMVELQRIAGFFVPLLKKWLIEYAGSGVAGIIVAISGCAAVRKLGSGRLSCPSFTFSIDEVLVELMNLSYSLVSVDKLHELASEAGFEEDFLFHFGTKVLPSKENQEVEFWIGLALKKLYVAFQRESLIAGMKTSHYKVQENSLATLGLFAYLGRRTRVFLSGVGIKDLDEQIKDFLSYLECGSLFIYPQFSSLSVYQHFMEVVTDEIGWLDFYASAFPCINNQEKRKSKHHTIQAETEMILSTVFTICYDVFNGFAHFSSSKQQPMDANLLTFLLRSQSLLTLCLEDYWAAYDRTGELLKVVERGALDPTLSLITKGTTASSLTLEVQPNLTDLMKRKRPESRPQRGSKLRKTTDSTKNTLSLEDGCCAAESKTMHESFLKKYGIKLMSTSTDILMGTQLLFIDITVAMNLLLRQLSGHNITKRERKKIERTLADITSLIPITILMLLPVSVVGHAAMFAAIKKYVPSLIPSPYSSERLDVVKQLKRTKEMDVKTWSNIEDTPSSTINM